MSEFKNKIDEIKVHLVGRQGQVPTNMRHACSAQVTLRGCCSKSPRSQLPSPIFITKKQSKMVEKKEFKSPTTKKQVKALKKVQPFVPIDIPLSPRTKTSTKFKNVLDSTEQSAPVNKKQIEIHIERYKKEQKQCLKKLFKKIHKLTQDLAESEKQRTRLQLQLNNYKNIDGANKVQERDLLKLQGENYKLRSDVEYYKDLLKQKTKQVADQNKLPKQIIKQVVIQKPVQVRIEVPKYIPGPQKIIEVPKIIENKQMQAQLASLKRMVSDLQLELSRRANNYSEPPMPAIVEKPIYLEKPVYIDRPVYIEKPTERERRVEVQVPVEVPIEVPVYIDKPVMDEELLGRLGEMQGDYQRCLQENEQVRSQNTYLRGLISQLQAGIEILKRHNYEKNHEIEVLLNNNSDYNPLRLQELLKKQTSIMARAEQATPSYITLNPYPRR